MSSVSSSLSKKSVSNAFGGKSEKPKKFQSLDINTLYQGNAGNKQAQQLREEQPKFGSLIAPKSSAAVPARQIIGGQTKNSQHDSPAIHSADLAYSSSTASGKFGSALDGHSKDKSFTWRDTGSDLSIEKQVKNGINRVHNEMAAARPTSITSASSSSAVSASRPASLVNGKPVKPAGGSVIRSASRYLDEEFPTLGAKVGVDNSNRAGSGKQQQQGSTFTSTLTTNKNVYTSMLNGEARTLALRANLPRLSQSAAEQSGGRRFGDAGSLGSMSGGWAAFVSGDVRNSIGNYDSRSGGGVGAGSAIAATSHNSSGSGSNTSNASLVTRHQPQRGSSQDAVKYGPGPALRPQSHGQWPGRGGGAEGRQVGPNINDVQTTSTGPLSSQSSPSASDLPHSALQAAGSKPMSVGGGYRHVALNQAEPIARFSVALNGGPDYQAKRVSDHPTKDGPTHGEAADDFFRSAPARREGAPVGRGLPDFDAKSRQAFVSGRRTDKSFAVNDLHPPPRSMDEAAQVNGHISSPQSVVTPPQRQQHRQLFANQSTVDVGKLQLMDELLHKRRDSAGSDDDITDRRQRSGGRRTGTSGSALVSTRSKVHDDWLTMDEDFDFSKPIHSDDEYDYDQDAEPQATPATLPERPISNATPSTYTTSKVRTVSGSSFGERAVKYGSRSDNWRQPNVEPGSSAARRRQTSHVDHEQQGKSVPNRSCDAATSRAADWTENVRNASETSTSAVGSDQAQSKSKSTNVVQDAPDVKLKESSDWTVKVVDGNATVITDASHNARPVSSVGSAQSLPSAPASSMASLTAAVATATVSGEVVICATSTEAPLSRQQAGGDKKSTMTLSLAAESEQQRQQQLTDSIVAPVDVAITPALPSTEMPSESCLTSFDERGVADHTEFGNARATFQPLDQQMTAGLSTSKSVFAQMQQQPHAMQQQPYLPPATTTHPRQMPKGLMDEEILLPPSMMSLLEMAGATSTMPYSEACLAGPDAMWTSPAPVLPPSESARSAYDVEVKRDVDSGGSTRVQPQPSASVTILNRPSDSSLIDGVVDRSVGPTVDAVSTPGPTKAAAAAAPFCINSSTTLVFENSRMKSAKAKDNTSNSSRLVDLVTCIGGDSSGNIATAGTTVDALVSTPQSAESRAVYNRSSIQQPTSGQLPDIGAPSLHMSSVGHVAGVLASHQADRPVAAYESHHGGDWGQHQRQPPTTWPAMPRSSVDSGVSASAPFVAATAAVPSAPSVVSHSSADELNLKIASVRKMWDSSASSSSASITLPGKVGASTSINEGNSGGNGAAPFRMHAPQGFRPPNGSNACGSVFPNGGGGQLTQFDVVDSRPHVVTGVGGMRPPFVGPTASGLKSFGFTVPTPSLPTSSMAGHVESSGEAFRRRPALPPSLLPHQSSGVGVGFAGPGTAAAAPTRPLNIGGQSVAFMPPPFASGCSLMEGGGGLLPIGSARPTSSMPPAAATPTATAPPPPPPFTVTNNRLDAASDHIGVKPCSDVSTSGKSIALSDIRVDLGGNPAGSAPESP